MLTMVFGSIAAVVIWLINTFTGFYIPMAFSVAIVLGAGFGIGTIFYAIQIWLFLRDEDRGPLEIGDIFMVVFVVVWRTALLLGPLYIFNGDSQLGVIFVVVGAVMSNIAAYVDREPQVAWWIPRLSWESL